MESKPFTSQYSNVYNEALYRIVPNPYGLSNVTGTQIHNRNIFDSSTISVHPDHANPQQQYLARECQQSVNCPSAPIRTVHEQIPGGVSFTFNSSPKTCGVQNFSLPCSPTPTYVCNPGQQVIQQCVHPQLNYFKEPPRPNQYNIQNQSQAQPVGPARPPMMIQKPQQNPNQVNFHYNNQTSTSDLLAPNHKQTSMGTPDFNNLSGIISTLRDKIETEFPIVVQQSTKILMLSKSPDIKPTCEEIREQDKIPPKCEYADKQHQTERRVSFEDEQNKPVMTKKKKKGKTSNKRKKKSRRSSKTRTKCNDVARLSESMTSFDSTDDDNDDEIQEDSYDEDDRR